MTTTPTNKTKASPSAPANRSKVAASLNRRIKAGRAWRYNEPGITYNGLTEPNSGLTVYYNSLGIGTGQSITNKPKN